MSRISQAINIDDKISNRSYIKDADHNQKHLILLTDQLDLITQALHKKSEEALHWKNLSQAHSTSPNKGDIQKSAILAELESQVNPLMNEITKLNQILENKQLENDRLAIQFQALERGYVEKSQQHQQIQTGQLLHQNRSKILEGENFQLKQQIQHLQNASLQHQQHSQNLINQNNTLQIQNQQLQQNRSSSETNQREINELHINYKTIIDSKHDEVISLNNWLDANKIKDDDLQKMKEYFNSELLHQKNLSREMLQCEEERVRKDEQEINKFKFEELLFENTRLRTLLKQNQEQKGFFETSLLKSRQNDDIEYTLNQNHQQKIQLLQLELEKYRQNQSFSSAFDMTNVKVDTMIKNAESKDREVSDLQYQNQLLKDQVQKKIDVIVQLESENEQLKEKQKFTTVSEQSGESMKIQYLLNHIETISKQLIQPTQPDSNSPQFLANLSNINNRERAEQSIFQLKSEAYGMAPVSERASMESSQYNTERQGSSQQLLNLQWNQSPVNYQPLTNPSISVQQTYQQPSISFAQQPQTRTNQIARYPQVN